MNIKLIRAFIASPSGLDDERRAAHAVAQQVNDTVARELGGRLELIGWEETLSGIGRPQALINADLETCDLFIGAMSTKWGTRPALDGPFTSGFEEEFELSRARYGRTGSPFMTVLFKEIDPLQLQDPGDELKKVLTFQERLRLEKAFLYDTFASPDAFADKVRAFLTKHTIRMLQKPTLARDQKAAEPELPETKSDVVNDETAAASVEANALEARFLINTAKILTETGAPTAAAIARIRLIGVTAGNSENDKVILHAHDANLLYNERHSYDFSSNERRGLLDTGLSEIDHENVPIWTWLASFDGDQQELLTALTVIGEDAQRVGALTAMRLLAQPIRFPDFSDAEFIKSFWLSERAAGGVKIAALRYLRDHGITSNLALIEEEVARANKDTLTPALEAALAIHLRESNADAANYVMSTSFETLDDGLLVSALNGLNDLGSDILRKGLDHRSAIVRARTIEVLAARGAINLDTIDRAKDDDAALVRLSALRALEGLGQGLSIDEARKIMIRPRRTPGLLFMSPGSDPAGETFFENYLTERLKNIPRAALETLLGSNLERHAAYLALAARRVGDFGDRLRSDLRDNFASYATLHWPGGIEQPYVVSQLLTIGTRDPLEIKRRELARQALEIVANQRDEHDISLVRHVLDSRFVSSTRSIVSFLRAFGSLEDVERLGRTSRYSARSFVAPGSSSAFDDAARAILKIQGDDLVKLVKYNIPDDMMAKIIEILPNNAFERLSDINILKLLLTDKSQIRRAMAMKIPASLPRRRVRRIFEAYRADPDGRFYIVTHWLDLGLVYPRTVARRVAAAKGEYRS